MNIAMKGLIQRVAPPAFATIVGAGAAVFGTMAVVTGSGILPVPLSRLLIAALPAAGLVWFLSPVLLPRRCRQARVSITFVVAVHVSCFLLHSGHLHVTVDS